MPEFGNRALLYMENKLGKGSPQVENRAVHKGKIGPNIGPYRALYRGSPPFRSKIIKERENHAPLGS